MHVFIYLENVKQSTNSSNFFSLGYFFCLTIGIVKGKQLSCMN